MLMDDGRTTDDGRWSDCYTIRAFGSGELKNKQNITQPRKIQIFLGCIIFFGGWGVDKSPRLSSVVLRASAGVRGVLSVYIMLVIGI